MTPRLKTSPLLWLTSLLLFSLVVSCGGHPQSQPEQPWKWNLPPNIPTPYIPPDNPMSQAKVDLGRRLFYEKKLSGNMTYSCSSCHQQKYGFTDHIPVSVGSTGEHHPRNAMSLTNAAYNSTMNWGKPKVLSLEDQALTPMFGEHPVEMGLANKETIMLNRLKSDPNYPKLFKKAFPNLDDSSRITVKTVTQAIAAFERTLLSFNSPYDRYKAGDTNALSAAAKRGLQLFNSPVLKCSQCHNGFNFTLSTRIDGQKVYQKPFMNTGQYNVGGTGDYPSPNTGAYETTHNINDMGAFKPPTLRNIEVTGPYMHDGSVATLEEVIDNYARGGRNVTSGPNAGDGAKNPHKNILISGFALTTNERDDLIAFLKSLTDKSFLTNPNFSDPFP